MMRWSHGHTLLAGLFGGLLVASHPALLLFGAALLFAAGVLTGRFWLGLRAAAAQAARYAGARVELLQAQAQDARGRAERRAATVGEQRKAEDRAYIRGATDQLHQLEGGQR